MKKIYISLIFVLCIIIVFAGCKENSTSPSANNNAIDTAYANITWNNNTVKFQESEILETDSTFTYFLFDAKNANAQKLIEGNIIYVYGKALKKVSTVEKDNRYVLINTEYCKMTEAITNGEIFWNRPINFNNAIVSVFNAGKEKEAPQTGPTEFEIKFPIGKDMNGKIKIKTEKDRMDASCEIAKEFNKFSEVKYGFEGYVQNMTTSGDIKIENSTLKEFNQTTKNIEGEITVQLVATGSLGQLLGPIELPFVIMKVPIVVAGFPMFLNLKVLFVINTETATIDASASIKSKFTFNSITGIKYNGTTYEAVASAGPYKYDFIKDSNWVASSVAAGLNFGLTFPRFELELFGEALVPYAHTAFLIGGSFTAGTKPCQTVDCSFIGAIGADLSFLGLKAGVSKTLWKWEQNIKKSGNCE